MSTIRVVRNDAGNCINFYGTSNPTYWNACLSASIDETYPTRINVRNDIRSAEEGTDVFEFYQIPYTTFLDKEGNSFESPAEAAQYITDNANVSGDVGTYIFSETELLDAQREETNTTVLFSNGDIYAVNALRAEAASNGTITIRTIRGDKDIYTNVRYYNVTVNDGAVSFNTISAAVDRLNEVLTGGTVGTDGGNVAGGAATVAASANFEVYGDRLTETGSGSTLGYTSTAEAGNFDTSNGILSVESITEAGEYFEFSQDSGDWTNTVGLTFGLFDETTYDRSDLEVDEAGNAVKAILRLRVKNSGFIFKDPASAYGRLSENGLQNQLDTRTTFRVGLDSQRRGYISMQLEDGTFQNIGRTETAIDVGTVLKFVAIFPLANELNGVRNMTVNTVVVAPTLTWYYIESPDGEFYYPLFTSTEEANYVDEEYGTAADGAGSSHQHLFVDESPSQNIWYMPDTYMFHAQSGAPAALAGVVWNEIATGDDANYAPTQYADNTVTVDEGVAINLPIKPAGDAATYNVSGIPTGLAFDGFNLVGNAPEVLQDNVTNPSDTFEITVTKANDYGSSVGTLTLVVTNTTAPATALSGFTWQNTSTPLVDSTTMDEGSVVYLDDTLQDGKRFVIDETWVEANILPNLTTSGDIVIIGARVASPSWGTIGFSNGVPNDFTLGMYWQKLGTGGVKSVLFNGAVNSLDINSSTDAVYDFGFEVDGTSVSVIACSTSDINTEPGLAHGGTFERVITDSSYSGTIPLEIAIATVSAEAGLSTSGISEIDTPAAPSNLTAWTKALDFSGSSERAEMVSGSLYYNPMLMDYQSVITSAPTTSGYTSNDTAARPWATAVVFSPDGNNSNQHIWNIGEGAGSTDDNIYLRIDANRNLYFGWGRQGALNEYYLARVTAGSYNGVYVGFNGTRLSGADATATNLAAAFDIRLMFNTGNSTWGFNPNPTAQGWGQWTTSGGRMDRSVTGWLNIGGRGTNRSFHGKVASFVTTTLSRNVAMPDSTEIEMMITDPIRWLNDYKVGNDYRPSHEGVDFLNFLLNNLTAGSATQVWLMGDGTNDSYTNMIRNQVFPSDQNYTKLNLLSMQSNDIETVNISGLS